MSDVPIFVHMSLPAILYLNNTLISAADFLKIQNLDLLSSAELLQYNALMRLSSVLKTTVDSIHKLKQLSFLSWVFLRKKTRRRRGRASLG